jgi:hypothetical protein
MHPQPYQVATMQAAQTVGQGICLRILGSMARPTTWPHILSSISPLCTQLQVAPTDVDVLFDLQDIPPVAANALVPWVTNALNDLASCGQWRTMIVGGSSFPQIIPDNSQAILPIARLEWQIWEQLLSTPGLQRTPDFADYTCHPAEHKDIPPYALSNAACKIRYTTDQEWLTLKGFSVKTSGAGQYYSLAAQIARRSEFCGAAFSSGDDYIAKRAQQTGTSGGHRQWITADMNHHMTYVVAQM